MAAERARQYWEYCDQQRVRDWRSDARAKSVDDPVCPARTRGVVAARALAVRSARRRQFETSSV
eukprot:10687469-Lingulodinium_polyedra.AAC.1